MPLTFDTALEAMLDGNAVAFLGAGYSFGAQNKNGESLKTASELASHLASDAGISQTVPLDQAAELYLQSKSSTHLLKTLVDEFEGSQPSEAQRTIAGLPWRRVYTTNYDDVFETAAPTGTRIIPLTLTSDPNVLTDPERYCIHINGFIKGATEDMLQSELRLTSTSYLTEIFQNSRWSQFFRYDIDLAQCVFFIGYSLYDLDIKRILFASESLREKCFFVTSLKSDDVQRRLLALFGEVAPIGTDGFASLADTKRRKYTPKRQDDISLTSFTELTLPKVPTALRDEDAIDLFTFGHSSIPAIILSLSGSSNDHTFHLHRRAAAAICDAIEAGEATVLIHGELGNGKSLIVDDVMVACARKGWRTFRFADRKPTAKAELEWICKRPERSLLCFENYPDHLDLLSTLSLIRNPSHSIIVTARSSVHDIFCQHLEDAIGEAAEFDINKLHPQDVSVVAEILDHYGLWGDLAAESLLRKQSIINRQCKSEMHAVVLRAFESPVIRERLRELVAAVEKSKPLRELAILAMILEFLGKRRTVDFVMQILDSEAPNQAVIRTNPALRQLISMQSGELMARSPVLAETMLHGLFDPSDVIAVLKKVVKVCHDRSRDNYGGWNPFRDVYRDAMQFGKVQGMLPERNRLPLIRDFYEYVKTLPLASRHPHFWLQYAVAMLSLRDYGTAKQYFKTSYALAEKNDEYDTSFIDNHYARFLLETTIAKGVASQAMQYFDDAADIIVKQARRPENRFYPYRVASKIREFYDKFRNELSESDKKRIIAVAKQVVDTMGKLESRVRQHRDVVQCERQLSALLG